MVSPYDELEAAAMLLREREKDVAKASIVRGLIARIDGGATTGAQAHLQISKMRAHLVARYRLTAVPGRPEELVHTALGRRVSLGYASRTIRVRKQEGCLWVDPIDFQIQDGWELRLREYLDTWFEHVDPTNLFHH